MGDAREQPRQQHLDLDVILGHIDRSTRLLLERGDSKSETVTAPDLFVHLKNLRVL